MLSGQMAGCAQGRQPRERGRATFTIDSHRGPPGHGVWHPQQIR
ncbi:hypothetical protein HNR30_009147 [Nonomuraea soli]|uniref:Uncharacterized protein n=1 Tax=Nonomuraea soli TaxID=1032476 RepID=A0A7W0CUV6_9ACTN|nr:hypothetical protein [Nonomuraea soli]